MTRVLLSPLMRVLQGSAFKAETTDNKGQPLLVKSGPNKGQPRSEYWMTCGIRKDDPEWPDYQHALHEEAAAAFPNFFPGGAYAACTHPRFAFKYQDGDGVDSNGKRNSEKEGWAGMWVVSFKNGFAPQVYHANHYARAEQVTDPNTLKCGFWVRISSSIEGNGVGVGSADPNAVPGLYNNMQMVSIEFAGPEIVTGPDPLTAFAARPQSAPPAGAFTASAGSPTPPAGTVAPPVAVVPPASIAPPPPAGAAALPPAPVSPVAPIPPAATGPALAYDPDKYMTARAGGNTYASYIAAGWTNAQLITEGFMVDHVPH